MNTLELWVATPLAHALASTVFHFLWQGALIALLLAVVLRLLRSPNSRYAAACIAMLVMLAAFAGTFVLSLPAQHGHASAIHSLIIPPPPDSAATLSLPYKWQLRDLLPWATPLWLTGVLLFHLRGLASWIAAHRLRRTGVCYASGECQTTIGRLARRLGVSKPVVLLESCFAAVPVVAGHMRPVILVPLGVLSRLPAAQVETILLHELAHIRRHDYLVNLFQTAAESFLFYHPAVWWVSGLLRAERENCCDDLVVATTGGAWEYAAALTALEQNRSETQMALAATGGNLVKRIRRLLQQPEGPRTSLSPVFSAVLLMSALAIVMLAWQSTLAARPVPAPIQASAPQQSTTPSSPYKKWLNDDVEHIKTDLATSYKKWLTEDVAYIITDQERAAYKSIRTDDEREKFIDQFWSRRDPTPGTPENEFKNEHYRRIAYANEKFSSSIAGWKTDRGRIYITFGPPDEIDDHKSGGSYQRPAEEGGGSTTTYPFQQWRYRHLDGVGDNIIIEFVDPDHSGEYHMTTDPSQKYASTATTYVSSAKAYASSGGRGGYPSNLPAQTRMITGAGEGHKAVISITPENKMYVRLGVDAGYQMQAILLNSGDSATNLSSQTGGCFNVAGTQQCVYEAGPVTLASGTYTLQVQVKDQSGASHESSTKVSVH